MKSLRLSSIKAFASLLMAISFFASYLAPELIHSAAHVLSNTHHVESQAQHSHHSWITHAPSDVCSFAAILEASTGLAFVTPPQSSAVVTYSPTLAIKARDIQFTGTLHRLTKKARGPPAATALA